MTYPELWGGIECTVNRVGDRFIDQMSLSGHDQRISDLDLFADLGVAAVRYPVLWERISPEAPDMCDWAWSDARLARLRALDIRVIAGLVHHGSGPRYTNLLDPDFASGLAVHARRVAERYDWIGDWTPVNEPVTTARFSALYGHWYPHERSEASFWLALLNQIDAVRLAMIEVRRINPAARLIQTEDLGRTYATASLRAQAAFDNERRWASWDLLCGWVTPSHPLWETLARFGFADRLRAIADRPCPPDVVGVNHYLTSDRFLDHRLQRYPPHVHGGNGQRRYADVEAVRVLEPGTPGLEGALREASRRYRLPVAITEVHNGSTRDEQLRWVVEAWDVAQRLRSEGIDISAVTPWALLGSHGWNTLLTRPGLYEPGVFDVSDGTPRPTAVATLLQGLGNDAERHPVVVGRGWWRRPIRLIHPAVPRPAAMMERPSDGGSDPTSPPTILIRASSLPLTEAFSNVCRHRDIRCVVLDKADLEVGSVSEAASLLDRIRPWAMVALEGLEAAGVEDGCGEKAFAIACAQRGIHTASFIEEGDVACRHGRPDVRGTMTGRKSTTLDDRHLIIKTTDRFSPRDDRSFAVAAAASMLHGKRFRAAGDRLICPTYVPDIINATLDLLIDGENGVRHLSHGLAMSEADFARAIAQALRLDDHLVDSTHSAVPVPDRTGMIHRRLAEPEGGTLPELASAIERFANDVGRMAALSI